MICAEPAASAAGTEQTSNLSSTVLHSRSRTNCESTGDDENRQIYDNTSQIKHSFGAPTSHFVNEHRAVRYYTIIFIVIYLFWIDIFTNFLSHMPSYTPQKFYWGEGNGGQTSDLRGACPPPCPPFRTARSCRRRVSK